MSRTRVTNNLTAAEDVVQKTYNPDGTLHGTYKWSVGGSIGEVSRITDEVTPGYRQRRKRGDIILNPVNLLRERTERTSSGYASITNHPNWGSQVITGDIGVVVEKTVGSSYLSYDESVEAIALIKAYATMNSSPIMGGEILGTFHQSISMLKHPFKNATTLLLRTDKRRNWYLARKSYNATRASAQAWLETRYGWKPIIGDCREAMRQASLLRQSNDRSIRVARGSASSSRSTTSDVNVTIFSSNWRAKGTKKLEQKVRASSGVIYKMAEASRSERIAQSFGLNARSLPSTMWELTPWSFTVDWFVNVGSWLEAIVPRPDVVILGSWTTIVKEDSLEFSGGPLSRTLTSPTTTYTGTWNGVSHKTVQFKRTVNPSLSLTPKLLAKPLSVSQTVDALSLSLGKITQMLSKMRH